MGLFSFLSGSRAPQEESRSIFQEAFRESLKDMVKSQITDKLVFGYRGRARNSQITLVKIENRK